MFGFGPGSGLPFRSRVGFGHKNWARLQDCADKLDNLAVKLINNEIEFKKNPPCAENQKVERLQNAQAQHQNEYKI